MWLANRLGFAHVDDLLAELSPAEFDERLAYYLLTGEGEQRLNLSIMIAEIRNAVTRICASLANTSPPRSAFVDPYHFVPKAYRPKTAAKKMSVDDPQAAERLATQLGIL